MYRSIITACSVWYTEQACSNKLPFHLASVTSMPILSSTKGFIPSAVDLNESGKAIPLVCNICGIPVPKGTEIDFFKREI